MNKIRAQITLEPLVKNEVMKILEKRGMKLSTIINNFLKDIIEKDGNTKKH